MTAFALVLLCAPDSPLDSEVGEERTAKTEQEGAPEERRKRSLLAALEQIGRREEEEEEEDEGDFQVPQQEDNSGFSVNKCILGAIILLGLGTIFLSGKHQIMTAFMNRVVMSSWTDFEHVKVKRNYRNSGVNVGCSETEVYYTCRCPHGPG